MAARNGDDCLAEKMMTTAFVVWGAWFRPLQQTFLSCLRFPP